MTRTTPHFSDSSIGFTGESIRYPEIPEDTEALIVTTPVETGGGVLLLGRKAAVNAAPDSTEPRRAPRSSPTATASLRFAPFNCLAHPVFRQLALNFLAPRQNIPPFLAAHQPLLVFALAILPCRFCCASRDRCRR